MPLADRRTHLRAVRERVVYGVAHRTARPAGSCSITLCANAIELRIADLTSAGNAALRRVNFDADRRAIDAVRAVFWLH
ncbi:hypothetical protein OK015_07140 [Mycobacterium sp. Aquia_216]|uniref:hypothetical protein n=1 Tax=Mycobacterium sp. Aquia_216 TaxID=2991729 RepID=UPI00227B6C6A|nr:hypothetical protein [Mycobacterium sp. Aquia_216]WAJ46247.1 hypothetical protein OK015_07140 [Mycobacterium sp. Aquia_216]